MLNFNLIPYSIVTISHQRLFRKENYSQVNQRVRETDGSFLYDAVDVNTGLFWFKTPLIVVYTERIVLFLFIQWLSFLNYPLNFLCFHFFGQNLYHFSTQKGDKFNITNYRGVVKQSTIHKLLKNTSSTMQQFCKTVVSPAQQNRSITTNLGELT